jgi:hypothetical protein
MEKTRSGMEKISGSGMNIPQPDHFSESLVTVFRDKNTLFYPVSEMEKL